MFPHFTVLIAITVLVFIGKKNNFFTIFLFFLLRLTIKGYVSCLCSVCVFHFSSVGQSWPEHPSLNRQSSLSSHPTATQTLQHSMSLDYSHPAPPLQHLHIHPAPNAHSSPRSSQRNCMARYALSRSPAQSFDEQDDTGLGYGPNRPNSTSSLLGNGSVDREPLTSVDGQNQSQLAQMQPPLLPEKKRASDGEHSLGTASPALSGFSSPHSGSCLSIPFPSILPDLSVHMPGTASPLPGKLSPRGSFFLC